MHKTSVPGVWRRFKNRYQVVGTQCETCKTNFYPPRELCPKCRRGGKISEKKFAGVGKIVTYTRVHAAPSGYEKQVPYAVAIVQLEEGPMLTAQIVDYKTDELKIGQSVRATFRKMYEDGDEGIIHYGTKFTPIRAS